MKKHILSILGVAYVCFALIMATNSQTFSSNGDRPLERHQDRMERENYRGDGYSQRLPGPSGSSQAERQFGWRPEYIQRAKEEAVETQAVTPVFQPNCMILWTAEWCPSCKSMYPIAKILQAEGYAVYVMDLDKNKKLAKEMRIRAVPTTLIRRDGVEVARRIGTTTLDEIKRTLTKN
jgi:thioredoxin 1